jgi:hypothetical protein
MHSVKKTDPNDVRFSALYLTKDLLWEVLRMKDKTRVADGLADTNLSQASLWFRRLWAVAG